MSIRLMAEVYDRQVTHPEQSILLAMADHARDDGTSCYPSVAHIAWKTGYTDRQVRRIMAGLRGRGALAIVADARAQRATEYAIRLDALPIKPPFRGDNTSGVRGDILSGVANVTPDTTDRGGLTQLCQGRADIAVSAEPSLTVIKPNVNGSATDATATTTAPPVTSASASTDAADKPPRTRSRQSREAKPAGTPRPRDDLFDAFCKAWAIDPDNPGGKASLAGAFAARCRADGASVDDFRAFYREHVSDGSWGRYVKPHTVADEFLAWRRTTGRAGGGASVAGTMADIRARWPHLLFERDGKLLVKDLHALSYEGYVERYAYDVLDPATWPDEYRECRAAMDALGARTRRGVPT